MNIPSIKDIHGFVVRVATDPWHTQWIWPLLMVADAVLTTAIIYRVPYTEIDYETYMVQSSIFLSGERNYTRIEGPTGPCVYPAGHVYIYSLLYSLTDGRLDVAFAQKVFAGIYLIVLCLVGGVYRMSEAPPYLLPLLILSKRIHSIFVLRLFNDCFAVLGLFAAILAFQGRMWILGSIALSLGLSIKMTLLLAFPGVLLVLGQAMPPPRALIELANMLAVQVCPYAPFELILTVQMLLAKPFLSFDSKAYLSRAFDFSRQFLFKWTVNWRFVGEETFLSKGFSTTLLILHAVTLFAFLRRWLRPASLPIRLLIRRIFTPLPPLVEHQINARVTPNFIATTILTSMNIGLLFARSLHYQFYAYLAFATPLLLWKAGLHPVLIYACWAIQEWAWLVFPSTNASSMVVVASLALQVGGVWVGTRNDLLLTMRRPMPKASAMPSAKSLAKSRAKARGKKD